jgi:N-acetylglucosamine-6-phosphate deacetylase
VKLANVVPDYNNASCALIRHLSEQGVVVGAGHTQATGDQVTQAVKAGLRYCIHFTNGLMSNSYKPFDGGGAIEGVLYNDALYAEIIADGFHVAPAYVRDIIARKGFDRTIGVTDAMFAAESQLEHITWVGKEAHVDPQRRYIALASGGNVLAGSLLMMDKAVENMLNWLTVEMAGVWTRHHPALTLDEALTAMVRMYAENPCRLTGLDRKGLGRLSNGAPADLCIANIEGKPGNYRVEVQQTIINGLTVFEHSKAL